MGGRNRCFWDSVPWAMRVGPRRPSPKKLTRAGALALTYSTLKITCSVIDAPRPPYSSGQDRPIPIGLGEIGEGEPVLPSTAGEIDGDDPGLGPHRLPVGEIDGEERIMVPGPGAVGGDPAPPGGNVEGLAGEDDRAGGRPRPQA